MTGNQGTFYTEKIFEYWNKIVGGVSPVKAGISHLGLPVFNNWRDAKDNTICDSSFYIRTCSICMLLSLNLTENNSTWHG